MNPPHQNEEDRSTILILYGVSVLSFIYSISFFIRAYIHNNIPIGWDTPHYISLVKIIQEQGFAVFLHHQKFTYILYPITEYLISMFTGISPFTLEKIFPVVIVALIIIMVGMVIKKWFGDTRLAFLGIIFSSSWFLLYRFGADLHANLFAVLLSLVLLYSYFDFKNGDTLTKKYIPPIFLALIGFTHIETGVFLFAIISIHLLFITHKHNLKKNLFNLLILLISISIPVITSVSQSTQILDPISVPNSAPSAQEAGLPFSHWTTSLGFYTSMFLVLGMIYIIRALSKNQNEEHLFLLIWAAVVIAVGLGSYFIPTLSRYAYRITFLFPAPFIASFGFYFMCLLLYKTVEVKIKQLAIALSILIFVVLASSSQLNYQTSVHLRPFVEQEVIDDLNYIKSNMDLEHPPIFIINDRDNIAGRVAQKWDNWIQAIIGDHFIYVGKINYFLRGSPTYYYDGLSRLISERYIQDLENKNAFSYNYFKTNPIIFMSDFNLRLNSIEKNYLEEIHPGIYTLDTQMLVSPTPDLKIDPAYESISYKGDWYINNRTWAENGYVMELYEPTPKGSRDYYLTYGFKLQKNSEVTFQILYFDYQREYSPVVLKIDDKEINKIYYEGTLEPYVFSYTTNMTRGDHTLTFSVDGTKPVMVNLNYITLVIP